MVTRLVIVCSVVLALSVAANASYSWSKPSGTGNWSETEWTSSDPNVGYPTDNLGGSRTDINTGQVTVDYDLSSNPTKILRMADSCLKLTVADSTGVTMYSSKPGSSELFRLGKDGPAIVDQAAGTVLVNNGDGSAETRIYSYSDYNLSGGIFDTEVLRRNDKDDTAANFTATGGTLVVRNKIDKFGKVSDGRSGFNQGTCLFAPGGLDIVGGVYIGTTDSDYIASSTSIMEWDLASDSSFDTITQEGNCTLDGTLQIKLLGGYTPAPGTSWDIWSIVASSGSGSFDTLPENYTATWVESDTILRLTYVPEPASLTLLGLGALALIRRRRS